MRKLLLEKPLRVQHGDRDAFVRKASREAITRATWSFGQRKGSRVSSANLMTHVAFITGSAVSANLESSVNVSCLYMRASLSTTHKEAIM